MIKEIRSIHRGVKRSDFHVDYMRATCPMLSDCSRRVEGALRSAGVSYTRLVDPDCYPLTSLAGDVWGTDLTVLELRGEFSRAFYLIKGSFEIKDVKKDFTIGFRIKKPEGLRILLSYLCREKIGKRHAKHSEISFILSLLSGMLGSLLSQGLNPFLQIILGTLVMTLIFITLEYPLSILWLKGVSLERRKKKVHVMAVKIGRKT
ncbi:hypothetical protein [Thermococcus sp.]|uniref:hypothetical protein n=1 Tax=Thermococcus sp. TaxID=35749 RepID=UPI002612505F|nr:hypothetical protein [Thermococcus sp.]